MHIHIFLKTRPIVTTEIISESDFTPVQNPMIDEI